MGERALPFAVKTAAAVPEGLPMRWRATFRIEDHELGAVLWSCAYFFCLLCSYYILRPVRDEMGIVGGVEQLQWLFTGTFVVMLLVVPLFGAATRRFARRTLLPAVYLFFIANLVIFFVLFNSDIATRHVARMFFIWLSVFNLFVVSVFWSFMADLFSNAQARRLFGLIAAGGSAGAVLGPALTAMLVKSLGPVNLLLVSAAFLLGAVTCIRQLVRWADAAVPVADEHAEPVPMARAATDAPMGGGILAGLSLLFRSPYLLGIALYILLYTWLATFLYFEQAHIVKAAYTDSATRTQVFAGMDLAVNSLTIVTQLFITARLVERLGLPMTLALVPALMLLGFAALGAAPVLGVLVGFQVMRRAGNYAVAKPAREMLFTVVSREEKYKAKNVIDTLVYRGGDAASGWLFAGLTGLGLSLSALAFVAIPVALVFALTALWLGHRQEDLRNLPRVQPPR
jgi:AAA family ATP:ADP antiporter